MASESNKGPSRLKQLLQVGVILFAAYFCFSIYHVFWSARVSSESATCSNNLRKLWVGISLYTDDNNDLIPPVERWLDAIDRDKYLPDPDRAAIFHCPGAPGSYGYALNASVGGRSIPSLEPMHDLVTLFDTASNVRNASGSVKDVATDRHNTANVVFMDGQAHWVNESVTSRWRWIPTK